MVSIPLTLFVLGLLYFIAHALVWNFQRTKIPDVLILICIGLFAGPILGIVGPDLFGPFGRVLTTVALAVILFESGLSLRMSELLGAAKSSIGLTLVTAISTGAVVALATRYFLGFTFEEALVTGAILCGTSSAVVIPMAKALKMSDRSQAIVVIESALTDVICIVLTISFLDSLASGSLSLGAITVNMLFSLSVAAFFGFLTGVIWQHLLEPMRRIENSMFTSIAYCLCVYGLSEMLGLSGAISVLAFGFTSSNFPSSFTKRNYAHFTAVEKNFFNEIIFILKTFFFIYLGLSIKIDAIWVSIVAILILPPLFYLRLWVTKSTLPRDTSLADSSYMAFLIPKGLAAAVLAGLPAQYGTPNADGIQSFVYSIVLFSILMTATLIALSKTPAMTLYLQKFFGKPTENNVNPLTASAHSPFAVMATQDRPKIENGPDQKSEPS